MDILVNFLLSQSVLIPIVMVTIRIHRLDRTYYPFFVLLIAGLLAELASFIFIDSLKITNAPVIKVYSLVECCIILYQLYVWKNLTKRRQLFILLAVLSIVVWIIDNIVFFNIINFSPYFRVLYSFIIILLSINQINAMMFYHEGPLFKSPCFIICVGFIIYFLYQIILEASFFIGSDHSVVANKIIMGFGYINLGINLLYAVAVFFITGKKEEEYNHYFRGSNSQI